MIDQDDAADDMPRKNRSGGDDSGGDDSAPTASEEDQVEPRIGNSGSEHLPESDRLSAELDKERARTAEMRDALMRTAADFDNFRKRLDRDRLEERKQAAAGMVKNLLPVLDAVGRALASASNAAEHPELAGFVEGIRMVEAQLLEVLKQAGLESIKTEGTFDPVHHEALMQEAHPGVPHMTILDVFEPGYRLGGRLLRPARVKVAYNPESDGQAQDDGGSIRGDDDEI